MINYYIIMLLSTRTPEEDDSKPPDIFTRVAQSARIPRNFLLQGEFFRGNDREICQLMLFDTYILLKGAK